MKPEFILGHQLTAVPRNNPSQKGGKYPRQPLKDEPPALWQKRFFVVAD